VFPISDSIKAGSRPYVNIFIIVINIIVFFYEISLSNHELRLLFIDYGLVPVKLFLPVEVVGVTEKVTPFLTSMFLHGGWFHMISNMYFLYIFGDNVEDLMGHIRYFFMYILFGLAAAFTQVVLYPDSTIPTIGASGAVSGVMGYYFVKFPHSRIKTLVFIIFFVTIIEIPAVFFLAFWFFMQFINGSMQLMISNTGGVAWWAHIGGFVAGFIYALIDKKRYYVN
jgi:membrane associated rhomboid family serine protease